VACALHTPLREVLQRMHEGRVGAMVVLDASDQVTGILTRSDVLQRVALAEVPLSEPVSSVMVQPVHTLPADRSAQEAALLMSVHGVRHVPVLQQGRLLGVVSERDLFALQRLSLKRVSSRLREARALNEMRHAATEIQAFVHRLLGQGVPAQQLTALISHLNDVLTGRLLELTAQRHGLDLRRVRWLALGSEGRNEQTIATDQDNARILGAGQQATPRFLRQLALNGLRQSAPLNWLGNIDTTEVDGRQTLDLTLQGTAIVVDVARLYALAQGVAATGTRERLAAVGPLMGVPSAEHQAWIGAFDFLQTLRLRAQLDGRTVGGNPNRIAIDDLHDIDRRLLKEVLRALRSFQQRVRLDYER
jgi:signal-transduction protein with cAMP-binding, CBS, and nucleotidyltransferase domain